MAPRRTGPSSGSGPRAAPEADRVQPLDLLVVDQRAVGDDVELGLGIGAPPRPAEHLERLPIDEGLAAPELDAQALALAVLAAVEPLGELIEERAHVLDAALRLVRLARLIAIGAG